MNLKLDGFQPVFQPTMNKTAPAPQAQKPSEIPREKEASAKTDLFEDRSNRLSMLEEMLKNSREQSEKSEESFVDLGKCMTIAARIMNGDSVPQRDHKFLAEKYPELYEQAILMRRVNHDPKEYDPLTEDEDKENADPLSEPEKETSSESGAPDAVTLAESAILSEKGSAPIHGIARFSGDPL